MDGIWRGAASGVGVAAAIVTVLLFATNGSLTGGNWLAALPLVAMMMASFAAAATGFLLIRPFISLQAARAASVAGFFASIATFLLWDVAILPRVVAIVAAGSAASLVGASLATRHALARSVGLVTGTSAVIAVFALWLWPGLSAPQAVRAAEGQGLASNELWLSDPGANGSRRVLETTYGPGTDEHRAIYGIDVGLRSRSVNGSVFLERWRGLLGYARTGYWGFDPTSLPLQARVWYPAGDDLCPLVLIVHGNHVAERPSEEGFDYLGQLLASRGFIAASIDQSFLNMMATDRLAFPNSGLRDEVDARAWLVLEHLRLWREWNDSSENLFAKRVDLNRIALIGHSRGGEAVAVAGVFNRMDTFPEDKRISFDYGFGIRAIAAIAPVDGQYLPGGDVVRLQDVSYMSIQGSHDPDVEGYMGFRVGRRTRFAQGSPFFRAGLFVYGADHKSFNRTWSEEPLSVSDGFLNKAALLTPSEVQQIARVFIAAFLEGALRDRPEFIALLRDHRTAASFLPRTTYLQQFADAETSCLADFDDDADPHTGCGRDVSIRGEGLSSWNERPVGALASSAAFLSWGSSGSVPASLTLSFAGEGLRGARSQSLALHLADGEPWRADKEPIHFSIELQDSAGRVGRVTLDRDRAVVPRLNVLTQKPLGFWSRPTFPLVLDLIEIPLRRFEMAQPDLDLGRLASLRLLFDRTAGGTLMIDDIGLRRSPTPEARP